MPKVVRGLLLLCGVSVGTYLVWQHGGAVGDALGRVGWGFAWFMAAAFVIYALDTLGWRACMRRDQPAIGFWRLFSMRMAGEALNKVTPLASMGGEPLKVYLLQRQGLASMDAITSVAVSKNTITIGQIAFIFTAIGLCVPLMPGRGGLLAGIAVFPGAILVAMVVTALIDDRLRRKKASAREEPHPAAGTQRNLILVLWAQFHDFYWANPREVLLSCLLFYLGWAAGALELLAGAWALGFPLTVTEALALEGLLVSVNMATFFIPANAGTQEGGFAYLAPLLGLSTPMGVALAVLRRCRDVFCIAFGLGYLALTEGRVLFQPQVDFNEAAG